MSTYCTNRATNKTLIGARGVHRLSTLGLRAAYASTAAATVPSSTSNRQMRSLPAKGCVDVWHASLSAAAGNLAALSNVLSPEERRFAQRHAFPEDRHRATVSRGLLRHLIGLYLNAEPCDVQITVGEQGKPSISDPLQFNVAHSGDIIAFAFSIGRNVGIDVERIDRSIDLRALAPNVLSPPELRLFEALQHRERVDAFFASWTRKEAFLKALGHGLTRPLTAIEVDVGPSSAPVLRSVSWEPDLAARCCVMDLFLRAGYAAALAIEGRTKPAIRQLDTPGFNASRPIRSVTGEATDSV